MFRRRNRQNIATKFRESIWPNMGYRRAFLYLFHRVARIRATPHSIACGVAWGAAISFTPFIGLHFLLAMMFGYMTRGNLLASLIGTVVGNPLTFPPIFAFTYFLGFQVVGNSEHVQFNEHVIEVLTALAENTGSIDFIFYELIGILEDKFIPLLVGGLICLPFVWTGVYVTLKKAVPVYTERRRKRIQKKKKKMALNTQTEPAK